MGEHLDLEAIRERVEKATPADNLTLTRYEHGGGRLFVDLDIGTPEGRDLVADFYEEDDREFYFAARTDIPLLLSHIDALAAETETARQERDRAETENAELKAPWRGQLREEAERLTTQLQEATPEALLIRIAADVPDETREKRINRYVAFCEEWGPVVMFWAQDEINKLRQELQEARREQMEACCRAVCLECADGEEIVKRLGVWLHRYDNQSTGECKADAIRRAFEEKGEGE